MSSITEFENYLETVQQDVFKAQSLYRSVEKRKKYLESLGYTLAFKSVPSGGVGCVFEYENNEFRVQAGYRKGYKALCVILNPFE